MLSYILNKTECTFIHFRKESIFHWPSCYFRENSMRFFKCNLNLMTPNWVRIFNLMSVLLQYLRYMRCTYLNFQKSQNLTQSQARRSNFFSKLEFNLVLDFKIMLRFCKIWPHGEKRRFLIGKHHFTRKGGENSCPLRR